MWPQALAAFVGGLLSLLAPCSALLLPAFFAYAFANRLALLRGTLLFLCGLCAVLLPLGLAAGLAGELFIGQRQATIAASGLVLVALGAWQMLGGRIPLAIRLPTPTLAVHPAQSSAPGSHRSTPPRIAASTATFGAGIVYGLTGFCSGPLLGGVLTLAATGETPVESTALLLVYALGMTVPLFVLASMWDRLSLGNKRWLRGRGFHVGPLSLHSTNLLSGGLFLLLGLGFIASQGGSMLSGAYDDLGLSALGFRLQEWAASSL